ncbi:hypothetical protein ACIQ4I_10425 [Rummeliibacillus sp. NPDC094406]|uniref:hypothetical protein n=1 Tax=Rummeliibacillus sp. NPDC094406 TaxID=3364511 RepID=UPI0038227874
MIPEQLLEYLRCFDNARNITDFVAEVRNDLADLYVEVDDDWIDILILMGKDVESNMFKTVEEWIMHYPYQDYDYDAIISKNIRRHAISSLSDLDFIELKVAAREYFDTVPVDELRAINEKKMNKTILL